MYRISFEIGFSKLQAFRHNRDKNKYAAYNLVTIIILYLLMKNNLLPQDVIDILTTITGPINRQD